HLQAAVCGAAPAPVDLELRGKGHAYVRRAAPFGGGRQYIGRDTSAGTRASPKPGEPGPSAGIRAIDPETGKTVWDFGIFRGSLTNGVLATAGGVLFASLRDGNIVALDSRTGRHLWHFQTGRNHPASPLRF